MDDQEELIQSAVDLAGDMLLLDCLLTDWARVYKEYGEGTVRECLSRLLDYGRQHAQEIAWAAGEAEL